MAKATMTGFLKENRLCKVGVAYELQVADQLPTEENDLPVEYLVTEKGVWKRQ